MTDLWGSCGRGVLDLRRNSIGRGTSSTAIRVKGRGTHGSDFDGPCIRIAIRFYRPLARLLWPGRRTWWRIDLQVARSALSSSIAPTAPLTSPFPWRYNNVPPRGPVRVYSGLSRRRSPARGSMSSTRHRGY